MAFRMSEHFNADDVRRAITDRRSGMTMSEQCYVFASERGLSFTEPPDVARGRMKWPERASGNRVADWKKPRSITTRRSVFKHH
jgi:hypothetical protein